MKKQSRNKLDFCFALFKKFLIIALCYYNRYGGLAQLASAFDWQSKGHGFESRILHQVQTHSRKGVVHFIKSLEAY